MARVIALPSPLAALASPTVYLTALGIYLPLALYADAVGPRPAQWIVAALTWAFLAVAMASASLPERRQVAIAVVVATGFEVAFAIVWGLYRYRYDNLPLYVPPGHGLIYLAALRIGATRLVVDHVSAASRLVAVVAATWVVAGLTLPAHADVAGASLLPWLLFCLLRTPRRNVYVGAFVATTILEILGTSFGNWRWADVAPGTIAGVGNPPSAIAGGYCLLDAIVLWLASLRHPVVARARVAPEPADPLPESA